MDVDTRPDGRARKVAAARKKLKTFRASRSSASSSSYSSVHSPNPSSTPDPLTTDTTNIPVDGSRSPKKPRGKAPPSPGTIDDEGGPSRKLRKPRSKTSLKDEPLGNGRHIRGHSRQASSMAGGSFSAGLARGTVMDLFEGDRAPRGDLPPFPTSKSSPGRIVTTPATPNPDDPNPDFEVLSEDQGAVKTRLDTFSFGSKPPLNTLRRSASPQAPPTRRFGSPLGSPSTSPTKRLSTPSAHGPSLLLTRPTPMAFSPGPRAESPGTPPTPARTQRHSHTRSNSISLPNLKLASRPPSLGIPVSPSFPTSPSSPVNFPRPATSLQGTRLKFEPSGRGAEAEKEKDEYRRKALEKLTGSPLPDELPLSGTEISLPDLDDEDTSSVASSVRPFSGVGGGFNFGRPMSSSSTPGLSWSSGNEDSPPPGDRWSGFSFGLEKEDGLGFGLPLTTTFAPAQATFAPAATNEGMTVPSRPSLQRNLSVLAEVEEPEEGDETIEEVPLHASPDIDNEQDSLSHTHATPKEPQEQVGSVPLITPTPSRLRQLQLLSSHSSSNSTPSASSIPTPRQGSQVTPGSPTKGYGMIGRGRPRPLALAINTAQASSSPVKTVSARTPQSAGAKRRGTARGGRSRGSSISYVKPESTSSAISTSGASIGASSITSTTVSRDWSISSSADIVPPRNLFFSPPLGQSEWSPSIVGSPPLGSSPRFSGWGNIGRAGTSRPCPRPKSIVGLGDGKGAGRVLGEVDEAEEDQLDNRQASTSHPTEVDSPQFFDQAFEPHDVPTSANSHESWRSPKFPSNVGASFSWRDPQLELEMERDALREDVELWKERCGGLEERLELEKKEVVVLRERVRKLGDRLSAVQSSHPSTMPRDRDNSGLLAEMRTQLFTLTAQLEQERKDKEAATQLAESLQAQLSLHSSTPKPSLLLRPTNQVPMAIVTPATPLDPTHPITTPTSAESRILQHAPSPPPTEPTSSPGPWAQSRPLPFGHEPLSPAIPPATSPKDSNDTRMRAWGFPSAPKSPPKTRNKDRDSFFGLSNPLQRNSIDGAEEQGMDLPPFDLAALTAASNVPEPRAVSDPLPISSPALPTTSPTLPRSSSLTSSASSAISFFSGYLPSFSPPKTKQRKDSMFGSNSWLGRAAAVREGSVNRLPQMGSYGKAGELDFRGTCKCCAGEVMEL